MPSVRRVLLAWSSGKDSAWALQCLRADPSVEVAGLLTTVGEESEAVPIHGTPRATVVRQAVLAGLPLTLVPLPPAASNAQYTERVGTALTLARGHGIDAVAFGDLFLADLRAWREAMLAPLGLDALFPLWGLPTGPLALAMLDGGLEAVVTAVDEARLPASFVGRPFDRAFLAELPPGCDPCGEHGEFHTLCTAGPMFLGRLA